VILSHIAARTSRIRLFSAVTLLSILDPVRVAEDYATLDHLSDGRLEVIIGKGNGPEQAELFGLAREQQWTAMRENYELLHSIWHDDRVTWNGSRRPALDGVHVWPKPLQMPAARSRSSKVHRYHGELGYSILHVPADGDGLTDAQHRATLELFQSDIAPTLRRDTEDPPWPEAIGVRSSVAV
jgi:alkanesulfonate monooxygenase SsuD/methylene tetrahydromethanopterin reductase-like flavin-dependent oxidoreductase (luciferase family)